MRNYLLAGFMLCAVAAPAEAAYVYSPGAQYATTEGPSEGILFQRGTTAHVQIGFDSSLFGSAPVAVREIAFRFDSGTNQNQAPVIPYDFGFTTIRLATNPNIGAMSGVYEDNLGSDVTTVLARDYALLADNTGPAGGPRSWGFRFTFDSGFVYDPSKGDLVLDLATSDGTAANATLDSIRSGTTMRYLYAPNGQAPVGAGGASYPGGPISRLLVDGDIDVNVGPVPEPGTWLLMIAGFGFTGAAMRRSLPMGKIAGPALS